MEIKNICTLQQLLDMIRELHENATPISLKSLKNTILSTQGIQSAVPEDKEYTIGMIDLYLIKINDTNNLRAGNLWVFFTENTGREEVYIHQFFSANCGREHINIDDSLRMQKDLNSIEIDDFVGYFNSL